MAVEERANKEFNSFLIGIYIKIMIEFLEDNSAIFIKVNI
jgi:hypothetical protein